MKRGGKGFIRFFLGLFIFFIGPRLGLREVGFTTTTEKWGKEKTKDKRKTNRSFRIKKIQEIDFIFFNLKSKLIKWIYLKLCLENNQKRKKVKSF